MQSPQPPQPQSTTAVSPPCERLAPEYLLAAARRRGFSERHAEKYMERRGTPPTGAPWELVGAKIAPKLGTGCLFALVGGRGVGKTQLCHDLALGLLERLHVAWSRITRESRGGDCSEGTWPRYTKMLHIFRDIRSTMGQAATQTERAAVREFVEPRLRLIYEAHLRGETEFEDRTLTDIVDQRYDAKRDTIFISNLTRTEFAKSLGASIVSRLHECGSCIECAWPSFRTPQAAAGGTR